MQRENFPVHSSHEYSLRLLWPIFPIQAIKLVRQLVHAFLRSAHKSLEYPATPRSAALVHRALAPGLQIRANDPLATPHV